MAIDLSTGTLGLFSGKVRSRPLPTLAIAALVTCAVAVPLIFLALEARDNPVRTETVVAPADAGMVLVDTAAGDPVPLDEALVNGSVLISLREPSASAVSFNLFAAGADAAVVESVDAEGPQFDFVVSDSGRGQPFDTNLLLNGDYELFITIRTPNEDRRTAVSFTVENP